jgi:hypothetical protein
VPFVVNAAPWTGHIRKSQELDKQTLDKRRVPLSGEVSLAGTIISIRRYTRHAMLEARCV